MSEQATQARPAASGLQGVPSADAWPAPAAGASAQDQHAERVRGIFSQIARRYELFNALSSMGVYRYWLRVMAGAAQSARGAEVLDVAGGAGDVTFELCRRARPARVELTDFTPEMLNVALGRIAAGEARGVPVTTRVADAMDLPYADASFDVVTVAYGLRNFSDRRASMREAFRVLRPGGTYVALEFSTPGNPAWRGVYGWYRDHVLPLIGGALTSDPSGFSYLASSIREFPSQAVIAEELAAAGFASVGYHDCTGGIATVYHAVRPRADGTTR